MLKGIPEGILEGILNRMGKSKAELGGLDARERRLWLEVLL